MPNVEAHVKPNFPITSISRLDVYAQCSERYRLKYVAKVPTEETTERALVLGSAVHNIFELFLTNEEDYTIKDCYNFEVKTLASQLKIDMIDINLMEYVGTELGELLFRASSRYHNKEKQIRNKDGSVPQDVINFPPASWTAALRQHPDINDFRLMLDNQAANCNPFFVQESCSYLLGQIYSWVKGFKLWSWAELVGVEMPLSTTDLNRVNFPNSETLALNGFIDLVVDMPGRGIVLIDHKTQKAKPLPIDVQHHMQLNLYAYAYEKVYGRKVMGIGIHHVPSGEVVLAEVDPEIQTNVINHLVGIQTKIDQEVWQKCYPLDFNAPCMRRDYKTKEVKSVCPYFGRCWPTYANFLK